MQELHLDLHISRLSAIVECAFWTDHLSGKQTKLFSCPVVSVRDLKKKRKIVKLDGHETEIPFFYSTGYGLPGTRVVTRSSPGRRRFLKLLKAEAVEIFPGVKMAILRRLKQVWIPDDIRS